MVNFTIFLRFFKYFCHIFYNSIIPVRKWPELSSLAIITTFVFIYSFHTKAHNIVFIHDINPSYKGLNRFILIQ